MKMFAVLVIFWSRGDAMQHLQIEMPTMVEWMKKRKSK